jgi:hypothetical protein
MPTLHGNGSSGFLVIVVGAGPPVSEVIAEMERQMTEENPYGNLLHGPTSARRDHGKAL